MTTVLLPREVSQEVVLLLEVTSLRRVTNFAPLAYWITRCARELISDNKVFARWYSAGVLLLWRRLLARRFRVEMMLSWNFNFCTVVCKRRLEQEAVILEKGLSRRSPSAGWNLSRKPLGINLFLQQRPIKNYVSSEFGLLERVIAIVTESASRKVLKMCLTLRRRSATVLMLGVGVDVKSHLKSFPFTFYWSLFGLAYRK